MIVSIIETILTVAVLASISFHLVSILAAARHRRSRGAKSSISPPVSVLIPLCGAGQEAINSLSAFCMQQYPQYQLIFGVREEDDPSSSVIRELIRLFPEADIELVVDSRKSGENPKISNLSNMLTRARHGLLVFADSDIRVEPDFLSTIIQETSEANVGMVTCLYKAGGAPGFFALLESIGISIEFAPGVLVADMLEGMSFALGAVMVISRADLERIGGLPSVSDYLADDYMLGNLTQKAGRRVLLSKVVVETMLQPMSFSGFVAHQLRWARGIRSCRPWGHFGSVITYGFTLSFLLLLLSNGSPPALLLFVIVLSVRLLAAKKIGIDLLGDVTLRRSLWLIPVRDILGFIVWFMALWGREVIWRGKKYRLLRGGKIAVVNQ